MAGFFGLFDYSKPGKGVRKDEPQKGRFVHFWELYIRKFWKLIQLNLLFLAFCIPVVTIGPAIAAHTYVLRNFATEMPVFLVSDFWDAFKANWKQSFVYTLLLVVLFFILTVATQFYFAQVDGIGLMLIPAGICVFMGFMATCTTLYVYLMIVTLDLPLKAIIKNGLILSILKVKTNLITILFGGGFLLAAYLFSPISVLVMLFQGFSFVGFIVCYNSYPGIQKYIIDPFLAQQAEEENGDADDTVFSDEQMLPNDPNQQ